jgi:hypothetical protein
MTLEIEIKHMSAAVNKTSSPIRIILLTGLVSLAAGVASGLLIHYFTEKQPGLIYDITTQEVFAGAQHNIGIFALRIRNSGNREIEQTFAELRFQEGSITERRVTGIPDEARSLAGDDRSVIVNVPFLNPQEQFSVQVLLADVKAPLNRPTIEVRGKGLKGAESIPDTATDAQWKDLLTVSVAVTAALAAAGTLLVTIRRRRGLQGTLQDLSGLLSPKPGLHSGADQRDAFAFALDGFQLNDDAQVIRKWPRKLSYWAASDILTASWLQRADHEAAKRGLATLNYVLESSQITPDSRRIISLNACRLALLIGRRDLAKEHMTLARKANELFVEMRINLYPELVSLREDVS